MRYKVFGQRTGLMVSELAIGGAMFGTSSGYGSDPDEVRAILHTYAKAGGNFINTADAYQLGESEKLIGDFIAPQREGFIIASKYSRAAEGDRPLAALGNSRKVLVQSVEKSLKRLRVDRIDIYSAHFDDGVTPIEEIVRGLDDLTRAGKIVYAGLSNFPAWRVATAATIADSQNRAPIVALELEYSLLQRGIERELLPMASAFGLGVLTYSPLAGGVLTGKYRNGETGRATLVKKDTNSPEQSPVLDAVIAIADELGVTPSQVAIAWVIRKGVIPIIGPRTRMQLDDSLGAIQLKLTSEQFHRLDSASAIPLGYPHDLLSASRPAVFGSRWDLIDLPSQTVV